MGDAIVTGHQGDAPWFRLRKQEVFADGSVDKKNGYSYLKWQVAWRLTCEQYPDAAYTYTKFRQADGRELDVMYYNDGTCSVECSVTIGGRVLTHTFPVINYKNQAVISPNAFQVNTARQRALVKTLAYHGLGLHIYEGAEDDSVLFDKIVESNPAQQPQQDNGPSRGTPLDLFRASMIDSGVDLVRVAEMVQKQTGQRLSDLPQGELESLKFYIETNIEEWR